jgi:hypothetical protein
MERKFWTERWTSMPALLDSLVTAMRRQRGAERIDVDEGWSERWDVSLPISTFARLEARTLVEEHARGACLVRSSMRVRPTTGGVAGLVGLAAATLGAMVLERGGNNSGSLALVLFGAIALAWTFRRIVLASARVRAAFDEVAAAHAMMPLGERPAWRPALAGVAAGTMQAALVIALGAFYVMTAAPTVWDAADDYFPAAPVQHVQPLPAVAVRPVVTALPAVVHSTPAATMAKNAKKDEHHGIKPGTRLSTRHPAGGTTPIALQRRST